ncbi:MAG: AbgT family transporter [Spirochaetaceae bacterium]|jgi:aminobenzoyl-glutamate transport protein|nr:AbgT family transporter [Spirochaetaceae bacterium]
MTKKKKFRFIYRILNAVESAGNRLPGAVIVYILLSLFVIVLSALLSGLKIEAAPGGSPVAIINLLTKQQMRDFFGGIMDNFRDLSQITLVIVLLTGIGMAEKTGMLGAAFTRMTGGGAKKFTGIIVIFAAALFGLLAVFTGGGEGAIAAGFAALPALAAQMFFKAGRSPLAGIFAAVGGMSAGISAALVTEFFLPGQAALPAPPFCAAAVFLLALAGLLVNGLLTAPRYERITDTPEDESTNSLEGILDESTQTSIELSYKERQGIRFASVAFLLGLALLITLSVGRGAFMADDNDSVFGANAPLIKGLVPIIAALFLLPAFVYGMSTGSIKRAGGARAMIKSTIAELAPFIALSFVYSQFIHIFTRSNITAFIMTHIVNMMNSGGASSIPAFALAATALPFKFLEPSIPLLFFYISRHQKGSGIGTLVVNLCLYALAFFAAWLLILTFVPQVIPSPA